MVRIQFSDWRVLNTYFYFIHFNAIRILIRLVRNWIHLGLRDFLLIYRSAANWTGKDQIILLMVVFKSLVASEMHDVLGMAAENLNLLIWLKTKSTEWAPPNLRLLKVKLDNEICSKASIFVLLILICRLLPFKLHVHWYLSTDFIHMI